MPLRAAVVSRFLKSAGFERSESYTTSIRGWHDYSTGFRAVQLGEDSVRVEYVRNHYGPRNDEAIRYEVEYLERVVAALDGKYRAKFNEGTLGPYVVVTK